MKTAILVILMHLLGVLFGYGRATMPDLFDPTLSGTCAGILIMLIVALYELKDGHDTH